MSLWSAIRAEVRRQGARAVGGEERRLDNWKAPCEEWGIEELATF